MHYNKPKNSIIKSIAVAMCVFTAAISFCGCGSEQSAKGYRNVNGSVLETQLLGSNSDYELSWDKDAGAVLFKSKENEKIWSDILYDAFLEGSTSANGNSPITITVANAKTLKWNSARSYSEIPTSGKTVCKKIENGIRVTYFFDTYKIAIPIDYVLRDDSVLVTIITDQILEDGNDYKLVSVSLAPFMCSVKNDVEGGYLFVPTGSGALMYTAETAEDTRVYDGEVYGADAARQVPRSITDDTDVKLPVFGVAGGGNAMLGIIEEGQGAAHITAQAGNSRLGYSNVGVEFYVRDYDEFRYDSYGTGNAITTRICEDLSEQKLSVAFYPLYGDDANYNGMAKLYREYMLEKGMLAKSEAEQSAYSVTFLGGTNVSTSFLGIPGKKTVALTTFSSVKSMVSELSGKNGMTPIVRLLGFGDNGILPSSIAGGKRFPSVYGTKEDVTTLADELGNYLYIDYDIVQYSKSKNGFSLETDAAQTAIKKRIKHYTTTPTRLQNKNEEYSIISRNKLASAAEFAFEKADFYNNKAVSFSSLGGLAYSDNADKTYMSKNLIEEDVANILSSAKKQGKRVATASANAYAAGLSDAIFDTPSDNGKYNAFDEKIPFYQMVFHSYSSMFTEAVNLSENYKEAVASAVAFGMGLGFSLTENYISDSNELDEFKLYGTVFEDNEELIYDTVVKNGFKDIFEATREAEIESYLVVDGVSHTLYSNGVNVYVNLNDSEATGFGKSFDAWEFIMN